MNPKKLRALEYAAKLEERLIAYDAGNNYWVYRDTTCYTVQRPDPKNSAIARCNYLARRNQDGK